MNPVNAAGGMTVGYTGDGAGGLLHVLSMRDSRNKRREATERINEERRKNSLIWDQRTGQRIQP